MKQQKPEIMFMLIVLARYCLPLLTWISSLSDESSSQLQCLRWSRPDLWWSSSHERWCRWWQLRSWTILMITVPVMLRVPFPGDAPAITLAPLTPMLMVFMWSLSLFFNRLTPIFLPSYFSWFPFSISFLVGVRLWRRKKNKSDPSGNHARWFSRSCIWIRPTHILQNFRFNVWTWNKIRTMTLSMIVWTTDWTCIRFFAILSLMPGLLTTKTVYRYAIFH